MNLSLKVIEISIVSKVIYGAIGLMVLFLLMSTLVMSHFNTTYNYTVTGLSSTTSQGLFLLVFVLALLGFGLEFMPKIGKG